MKKLLYLVPVLVLVGLLVIPSMAMAVPEPPADPIFDCNQAVTGPPSDRGIEPCAVLNYNNPTCEEIDSSCPNSLTILQPIEKKTYPGPAGFSVTITSITTKPSGEVTHFSFMANRGVCQVIVKDGSSVAGPQVQTNVYTYGSKLWDGNLHPPVKANGEYGGISHITFCYSNDVPVDPVPEYPTIILVVTGLLGLGGFVLLRNRKRAQKTA